MNRIAANIQPSQPILSQVPVDFVSLGIVVLVAPCLVLVFVAKTLSPTQFSEASAVLTSIACAAVCWGVAGISPLGRAMGKAFYLEMSTLIALRIACNLAHFYWVFAPAAGIQFSDEMLDADFSGDLGPIYGSAMLFLQAWDFGGFSFAMFGDYYRGINNPGVGIIYGTLIGLFGPWANVAVPWAVLYSAIGSVLLALTGRMLGLSLKHCKAVAVLVFLMPAFFIFPPIYRDNFIIFLLCLTTYTCFAGLARANIAVVTFALATESVLLFGLRLAYVLVPGAFASAVLYLSHAKGRSLTRRLVFVTCVSLALILCWTLLSPYIDQFAERFSAASQTEESDFSILVPFKQFNQGAFYLAAAVFSLLAPMPWWQVVDPSILAYQVFGYAQTWFGLTAIVAVIGAVRERALISNGKVLIAFAVMVFLLALFGSLNFGYGYVQVAMPFLVLASMPYLAAHWRRCVGLSAGLIGFVHVILLFRLM